ncbi:MAG: redox-sensing transcriptional repressor Rex, partial [Actinobacteria bacterium]|nr:redox-sensing transcriptional repressor Rex [Actinomycetota bacterium]
MPPKKNGDLSLPEPVVERLPLYQRILTQLIRQGSSTVSSEQLA